MPMKTADLMAQVAHDMGSPLALLQVFLRQVAAHAGIDADPDFHTLQRVAAQAIERLAALRDNLRQEAAAHGVTRGLVDVAQLARDQLAAIRLACEMRQLAVYYTGPRYCMAIVDKALLGRVFQNLLANAAQAMTKAHGHLWIQLSATDEGDLEIHVADNGAGIAPSHLERIFDKGFTHGKVGGTGLGLAFCHATIAAHRGTLTVASAVGRGTCFQIRLPEAAITTAEWVEEGTAQPLLAVGLTDASDGRWHAPVHRWQAEHGVSTVAVCDPVAPLWLWESAEVEG